MQNVVFEEPYRFVPPHEGLWWPNFIQRFRFIDRYLRKNEGVVSYECRDEHLLAESLSTGHGILLTPNHARPGDPIVMGFLTRRVHTHVFAMASWHLFKQDRFTAWAIHKMGGFSVYREGIDRRAINTSIKILTDAARPLIIFPEGSVTRTNDRLHALLDGISFIARTAAKQRARQDGGKVIVHPIAIKYLFQGNLEKTLDPMLSDIEHRLSWQPQNHHSLLRRIDRLGQALLCLKEIQYFGSPQSGQLNDRLDCLIDRLLGPIEEEWQVTSREGAVVPRVKALRMKILPAMVRGDIDDEERDRRWGQLADIYLAQQVSCYLADYLAERSSIDRLLETVERFEEDLTDELRPIQWLKVILQVGEGIEVSPHRDRSAAVDPLMVRIEGDLQTMLDRLSLESPLYTPGD